MRIDGTHIVVPLNQSINDEELAHMKDEREDNPQWTDSIDIPMRTMTSAADGKFHRTDN